MFCQDRGRHVHVDYCRVGEDEDCGGPEIQHIEGQLAPHPERAKDWVSHSLFWRRTGEQ